MKYNQENEGGEYSGACRHDRVKRSSIVTSLIRSGSLLFVLALDLENERQYVRDSMTGYLDCERK
jgi:hypothetical protein